jgi:hypothetical protein
MGSFMGVRWGVNALDFKNAFIYTLDLKWKDNFYLEKFELEDISFEKINFMFFDKDLLKPPTLNKSIAHLYFLNEIEISIRDCFFDYLARIFRYKYGKVFKTKTNQGNKELTLIWVSTDQKRMIVMNRYSREVGISKAFLIPYNPEFLLSNEKKIKKIAAQL